MIYKILRKASVFLAVSATVQDLFLLNAKASEESQSSKDGGISFVVIGDFGWSEDNFGHANIVFDQINEMKRNSEKDSIEDFDFFVTVGDNLYPKNAAFPQQEEFDKMMDLWNSRNGIKDLPIYPIRGNHDCYFEDQEAEINLSKKHPNWVMPDNYYEKQFEVGENGEKFSLLQLDSCYMLCVGIGKTSGDEKRRLLESLDDHSKQVYLDRCEFGDKSFKRNGEKMMEWIDETMANHDDKVIWKVSNQHHPMFGLSYLDYQVIINEYLPKLQKYNYDAYFHGHEHLMNHGTTPMRSSISELTTSKEKQTKQADKDGTINIEANESNANVYYNEEKCLLNSEMFLRKGGNESETRNYEALQGEELHHFTMGASGKPTYNVCEPGIDGTKGNFTWFNNKYHGFALVKVSASEFTVTMKGFFYDDFLMQWRENDLPKLFDLFEVKIKRDKNSDMKFMQ